MNKTYDAIIIGTGQAGPLLAQRLAGAGMKIAGLHRPGIRANVPQVRQRGDHHRDRLAPGWA
jgi:choline dehydrogenase-like flavoprotein